MVIDSGDQLLEEQDEQYSTDGRQVEVMHDKGAFELQCASVAHDFATTKDDEVVGQNCGSGFLQGRHGRLSGLEVEVLRVVSHDSAEGAVEDWPEVHAKGALDAWEWDLLEQIHRASRHRENESEEISA